MTTTTFLVTGASGFVGRSVCEHLASSGHRVHALVRRRDGALEAAGARVFSCDVWDPARLSDALAGVDVVIHCAGDAAFGNGAHYQEANVELTRQVMAAVRADAPALARFVYVSTIGTVDRRSGDRCEQPLTEESEPFPSSDYGASKLAGERAVRESGLPFSIVRLSLVVGPAMRVDSHFAVFTRHALNRTPIGRIAWPGRFSVVHVEDVAQALRIAATHPQAAGRTFFCAGSPIGLDEYFDRCAPGTWRFPLGALARPFIAVTARLPFALKAMLLPALTADDAALRALGWKPRHAGMESLNGVLERERCRTDPQLDPGGQTVVTGAASGLGRALVEYLAPRRKRLLLLDRDGPGLAEIASRWPHCRTAVVDLSEPAHVDSVLKGTPWKEHPITEFFACAGFGLRGATQELSREDQQKLFAVNLMARFSMAHQAIEQMLPGKFGRVVLISSSSAFQPLPFMAAYAASNVALLHLGEAWAEEVGPQGVHLMTVCPGGMETNFQQSAGVRKLQNERLMPPAAVAREIVAGLARQRRTLIVSTRSFAMSMVARLLPRRLSVRLWRKLMAKMR